MNVVTNEAEMLARLVDWARKVDLIRVVLLTSSRALPDAPVDVLSDYDVALVVGEAESFVTNDDWAHGFGVPFLRVRDTEHMFGLDKHNYMVLYDDGTNIDYSIWPLTVIQHIRTEGGLPEEFDLGYRVLLDKDELTRDWPAPTYTAHIPAKPTEQEYRSLIEEFWWCATYVAKNLWRDEFMPAKVIFDFELKYLVVRRMLEWRIEIDHQWSVKPGFFGRGLRRYLDAATWVELEATYVGSGRDENWMALYRTIGLFRRVAGEVGDALGYPYPHDLDATMTSYLRQIQGLPPERT